MKVIYNNKQLCHVWAHQTQQHGRNANKSLFFNNKVIYSYGDHFPAAKIYDDVVLINSETYSNTTAKHLSNIRSAVTHRKCLYAPNVLKPDAIENHEFYIDSIIDCIDGVLRSRKHFMSSDVVNQINAYKEFCKVFGLYPQNDVIKLLDPNNEFINDLHLIGQENAKHNELREALKKEKQYKKDAERINRTHSNLHLWYLNSNDDLTPDYSDLRLLAGYLDHDLIRVKDEKTVETHRGAEVPMGDAWPLLNLLMSKGVVNVINKKVGHFRIDQTENKPDGDVILTIGCHKISMKQSMAAFQHHIDKKEVLNG